MKTRLIYLVLLIVCLSCGTNNKPLSDAQKEKIKGEAKEVVNTYIKGCEEANSDMLLGIYLDSPDFVFTYNGTSFSYKSCTDLIKSVFGTLNNQKITVVDEKYAVLDNSTVMVTVNNKCLLNYKDGHSVLQDPWISQMLFKKIDNKWKVISGVESGIEQSVKNKESSKELNQIELMKQVIGNWKCNLGKDTIEYLEYKYFGTGLDCYFKFVTKGKTFSEARILWGYDKGTDKLIGTRLAKEGDITLYGGWFTSNNIFKFVNYNDINSPETASTKYEVIFKSSDLWEQTTIVNNTPTITFTYVRIK
jgi:hypothetical protein